MPAAKYAGRYYVNKRKTVPLLVEPIVDWGKLLREIVRLGYPKQQIANRLNVGKDTIDRVLGGIQEPKYSQGVMLKDLHKFAMEQEGIESTV